MAQLWLGIVVCVFYSPHMVPKSESQPLFQVHIGVPKMFKMLMKQVKLVKLLLWKVVQNFLGHPKQFHIA